MFNLSKFFNKGLKDSVLFLSNGAMSHNGPWKQVYTNTLLDRFHVGDFSSAEYTISVDYDKDNVPTINKKKKIPDLEKGKSKGAF